MNLKTTVALFFVLVSCVIGVWIVTYRADQASTPEQVAVAADALPVFAQAPDKASVLKLEVPEQPTLRAERTGPFKWVLVEPLNSEAEAFGLDAIYTRVKTAQVQAKFNADDTPPASTTGLDNPRATITAWWADGEQQLDALAGEPPTMDEKRKAVVRVGNPTRLNDATYAQVGTGSPSDPVYLLQGNLLSGLNLSLGQLRSKTTLAPVSTNVTQLRIDHPDRPDVVLERSASGDRWMLTEPVRGRGDATKIRQAASMLNPLRVNAWLTDDELAALPPAMFDPPALRVHITAQDAPPAGSTQPTTQPTREYTLEVGGFANVERTERLVRVVGQPGVGRVILRTVDTLFTDPDTLRFRGLVEATPEQVRSISITGNGGPVELLQQAGNWQIEIPEPGPADAEAVKKIVTDASRLSALRFMPGNTPLEQTGLDTPTATLTIAKQTGEITEIKFGKTDPSGAFRFAQVGDEDPLLLSASVVDGLSGLSRGVLDFASREALTLAPTDLREITLSRVDGEHTLSRPMADAPWTISGPTAGLAGPSGVATKAVDELVNGITKLAASEVVGIAADAAFQPLPDEPAVRITLGMVDGSLAGQLGQGAPPLQTEPALLRRELTLFQRSGRGLLARIEGRPYVYRVPDTLWGIVTRELADRTLGLAPAPLTRVTIQPPGQPAYTLIKQGMSWTVDGNELFVLDAQRLDTLLREITHLQAQELRAVEFEPADMPVSVSVSSGGDPVTVDFGATNGLTRPARISSREVVLPVLSSTVDDVTPPLRNLAEQ